MPSEQNRNRAMPSNEEQEVVGRSTGMLEGGDFPEGLKIKYDIQITTDRPSPPDSRDMAEEIAKKVEKSSS